MTANAKLYLSVRNVKTLLSKLDRAAAGDLTACTIVKYDNTHPVYPQTMDTCFVKAVEFVDQFRTVNKAAEVDISRTTLNVLLTHPDRLLTQFHNDKRQLVEIRLVADAEYYAAREPGAVSELDDPGVQK